MNNRFLPLFAVAAAVSLYGCVSYPDLMLTPKETSVVWAAGKAVAAKTSDGAAVQTSFDRSELSSVIFDVTVRNMSRRQILVDPALFSCICLKNAPSEAGDFALYSDMKLNAPVYALNPEAMIDNVAYDMKTEDDSYQMDQTVNAVGGCMSAGAAVSGSKPSDDDVDFSKEMDEREQLHIERMRDYSAKKQQYESSLLRKTTLAPGSSVSGKVYFTAKPDARAVQLDLILDGRRLYFQFDQSRRGTGGGAVTGTAARRQSVL